MKLKPLTNKPTKAAFVAAANRGWENHEFNPRFYREGSAKAWGETGVCIIGAAALGLNADVDELQNVLGIHLNAEITRIAFGCETKTQAIAALKVIPWG